MEFTSAFISPCYLFLGRFSCNSKNFIVVQIVRHLDLPCCAYSGVDPLASNSEDSFRFQARAWWWTVFVRQRWSWFLIYKPPLERGSNTRCCCPDLVTQGTPSWSIFQLLFTWTASWASMFCGRPFCLNGSILYLSGKSGLMVHPSVL